MSTRRKYDLGYKLRAIRKAESIGNRPTGTQLGIDESVLRDWRKHKVELETNSVGNAAKKSRLPGGGRKSIYSTEEEIRSQWVIEQRELHLRVTRSDLAKKAKELIKDENFKSSRGWVDNFLRRNQFSIRRHTTVGQRLPADLYPKVEAFIKFNANLINSFKLPLAAIGNMDETAIWSDMPSPTTIAPVGAKSIPLLTTGHEKQRTTVALTALANGQKLPPYVIFKGKRLPSDLKGVRGVIIAVSPNGWMTEELVIDYLNRVWGQFSFNKRLLVWDSLRAHITDRIKASLHEKNTLLSVIPGGCTRLCQPADVSWNAPFKANFRNYYAQWLAEGRLERTDRGNLRSVSKPILIDFVKMAWKSVSEQVIRLSFDYCGITSHDPNVIHCTKHDSECEAIREQLINWTPEQVLHPVLFDEPEPEEPDEDQAEVDDGDQKQDTEDIELDLQDLLLLD